MAGTKVSSHVISDNIALGGSPTTTTQSASDNSTKLATTAYVTTAIANLADSAPSTLNTLNELAAALGDDANFSTTVTNSLATKSPLASPTFTGNINAGDGVEIRLGNSQDILFKHHSSGYGHLENKTGTLFLDSETFTIRTDIDDLATAMFIDASHNVGIGTGSPASKLHISGNSDISDEDCMLIIDDVDGSAGSRIPAIMFRSNTGGNVTNQARIRGTGTQGMVLSGSSALGDDLVVQASGVGIGTNSPTSWASYTDSAATVLQVADTSERARVVIKGGNGAHLDLVDHVGGTNDKHMNIAVDSGVLKFGSLNDAGNAFVKDNIMVQDLGTGRVGIGISSPSAQLDVDSGATSDIVKFQNDNGSFIFGKTANLGSLDMASDANFRIRHGSTLSATFTSSGKVGIGEASPDLDLHIKKTSTGSTGIAIENTNNGQNLDIDFYNNSGSAQARLRYAEGAGYFELNPNVSGTSPFTILYGGDVLFGSSTNLDVLSGTPKIQVGSGSGHSSMQFYSGTGSVGAIYFGDATSGADRYPGYIEYRHNNDKMALRASGADQVVIGANETKFTGRVELSNGKPIFSETDNGTHHYSHLCTGSFYQGTNQGVAINTNIPSPYVSGNNMFSFKIHGFAYDSTGGGVIDVTIGTYSGENGFYNNTYSGQNIPKQWQGKIRLCNDSNNKVVILLGDTDTSTNYEIAVSCGVQGFYGVDPDYFSGWTTNHFTSTSAYSNIVTVQPKETQMIGFAARSQGFTKTSGWSVISDSMTTVDYDFGGYLNTSNGRFTPAIAGMYLFSVGGYSTYSDSSGSSRYAFALAKNSSTQYITGGNFCNQDSPLEGHSRMIYLNGDNDYVELRMYSSIGGSGIQLGHPSHSMWWEAHLVNQSNSAVSWTI